jgi:ADP-heptose:LPS heptosyltransferase
VATGAPARRNLEVSAGERIVVLRALGIGDLCTAVPVLRALRRRWSAATLCLAAPSWLQPLVERIEAIDELLPTEPLGELPAAASGATLAVNLHGRGPQSTARLVETGPHQLVAFAHPSVPASMGGPAWRPDEHEIDRWCRLVEHHGIAADRHDVRLQPASPGPVPTAGRPQALVVHLGASAAARRWPASRWARVVEAVGRWGWPVLLTGAASDRADAEWVRRRAGLPASAVLAGRTDLGQLCDLVAGAALVVSGDTGVAHLATGYAVPSVVLFGPTSPAEWGPRQGPHTVLWAGRRGDPHATTTDAGLLDIDAGTVIDAVRRRLHGT